MSTLLTRPKNIDCADWSPSENDQTGRKCLHYLGIVGKDDGRKGRCGKIGRPDVCEEWERAIARKNNESSPAPSSGPLPTAAAPSLPSSAPRNGTANASSGLAAPVGSPPPVLTRLRGAHVVADVRAEPALKDLHENTLRSAMEVTDADLASLEDLGATFAVVAPGLETSPALPVVLVPARTGRHDRNELTFRDAATIRWALDAFPGSRIARIDFDADRKKGG